MPNAVECGAILTRSTLDELAHLSENRIQAERGTG
jgi:hypothetical protein